MNNNNLTRKQLINNILKWFFIVLVAGALFFGGYFLRNLSLDKELKSLQFFLQTYKQHYYYADEEGSILHDLSDGVLDAYSQYYTKEEYEAYKNSSNGSHFGFGIAFSNLTIVKVSGNSPAERAGIPVGSTVIGAKIEGQSDFTVFQNLNELTNFLSQVTDQKVVFKVEYQEQIEFYTIQKSNYKQNFVYYTDSTGSYRYQGEDSLKLVKDESTSLTIPKDWGYIKFTSFSGLDKGTNGAVGQFDGVMNLFNDNNNDKIIIDLRGNGGGYMSIMCELCRYLCNAESGDKFLCTSAIYRDGKREYYYAGASKYNDYSFEKIIFLADEGSASASEALMGAVLDYDASSGKNIVKVIVEPSILNEQECYRTYGKGIMQTTYVNNLTGEALKLTTAEIRWPVSDRSIHGVGLNPSIDSRIIANKSENAIEFALTM